MNVISINVRGLGDDNKWEWIRNMRRDNEAGMVLIQETQLISLDGVNLGRLWGNDDFMTECVPSNGRSGGLLSIWDTKVFNLKSVIKHQNFIFISGSLKDNGKDCCCGNVYIRRLKIRGEQ